MTILKYDICSKVFFLNTASAKIERAEVKGVQVIPTGISKSADGENVLDGCVVLYQTVEGPVLAEDECFATEEECRANWLETLTV